MSNYFSYFPTVNHSLKDDGTYVEVTNILKRFAFREDVKGKVDVFYEYSIKDGERPDIMSKRLYGTEQYHWTFLLLNPQIKNIWDDWPMKQAQLEEYCTQKYQYLAADTNDDLNNKFILGETVTGSISNATGKIKEIHVNMGYLVIEKTTGTFAVSGEAISGIDSQDNISCNFIKSQAYAPHHHTDASSGDWVMRRAAGTLPYTYIDYESAVTEQNRNIKVIKQAHITTIAAEFIAAMGV